MSIAPAFRFFRSLRAISPLCALLAACGTASTKALPTATLDVALDSAVPTKPLPGDKHVFVGFADDGSEKRFLVFFKDLVDLARSATPLDASTSAVVRFFAQDVPVARENILLCAVTRPWTPDATWNLAFSPYQAFAWTTPGGDYDTDSCLAPSLKSSAAGGLSQTELDYDVVAQLATQRARGVSHTGFLLRVARSPLNFNDAIVIGTSNADNAAERPQLSISTDGTGVAP